MKKKIIIEKKYIDQMIIKNDYKYPAAIDKINNIIFPFITNILNKDCSVHHAVTSYDEKIIISKKNTEPKIITKLLSDKIDSIKKDACSAEVVKIELTNEQKENIKNIKQSPIMHDYNKNIGKKNSFIWKLYDICKKKNHAYF